MDQVSSATPPSSPILVVDGSEMAQSARRELCNEAQRRGWKLVELGTDDGYPEIDIAAARHGADIVAFAGPARSQCKAAVVASGRELPYAYLPAGRRDLFARELGIDTDDVVRALGAIEDCCFFFSSRRRHTSSKRDWSSDVCSSDLTNPPRSSPRSRARRRGRRC